MTAQSWGRVGTRGVLGRGTGVVSNDVPGNIDGGLDFVQVECCNVDQGTSIGRTSGGDVYTWGDNGRGLLGNGSTDSSSHQTPTIVSGLSDIVDVAASHGTFLALESNGDLYGWGNNTRGELGLGDGSPRNSPTLCNTGVIQIAPGAQVANIVLKTGAVVQTVGSNSSGELANGSTTSTFTTWQTVTPGSGTVIQVATYGNGHYILLSSGDVYGAGNSPFGELMVFSSAAQRTWKHITSLSDIILIINSGNGAFFVKDDGTTWALGLNNNGRLGSGQTQASLAQTATPVQVDLPSGVTPVATHKSQYNASAEGCLCSDGKIYTWGEGANGQMGNGTSTSENPTPIVNPNIAVADWFGGRGSNLFAGAQSAAVMPAMVSIVG